MHTMNEQAMKFRFGIFVLAVLILLAVLVILFGGVPRYFTTADRYTIIVDNALGVTPGTPVQRSGVKIGEVRDVELDDTTGDVRLSVLIEHGHTLRKSDRPTIVRGLLGGDTSIDFLPPVDPKKEDLTPVAPGSELRGVTPPDAGELVQKTGDLLPPAKASLEEMQKVLQKLDKMTPLLEETLKEFRDVGKATNKLVPELQQTASELRELTKITRQAVPDLKKATDEFQLTSRIWGGLGERLDLLVKSNEPKFNKSMDQIEEATRRLNILLGDDNQKSLQAILKNTRSATEQFDSIARNTDEMIKEARVTIKNLNSTVLRADDVFKDFQKMSKPFSERTPSILKNLDDSSATLNKVLIDFRELTRDIARSEGTLSKLIQDPSLYNNLNESASMTAKILPRLDRILADVEIFADKIARHPESLGIGGVVRPSSGLKESPSGLPWKETPGPHWRIWQPGH
jgi:phospholipid/cholesterol/gamma-HCH transport system substrate-binding protein